MATSLLALIDDISLLADDVAAMSKVAAKKTAGVLGDDIALNANQVTGFAPSRELPVVIAVAKGSAINKAILVPIALLLVVLAPWALTPLLMLGGAFLCYEGVEKVLHSLLHSREEDEQHHKALLDTVQQTPEQIVALEREKIKGAVRTDFILSAEIIAITLGTMQGVPLAQQATVLVAISIAFTIGVYALVAGFVKLDDLGIYLCTGASRVKRAAGRFILLATPYLMRALSIGGTVALFLVGGGIIVHGLPILEHLFEPARNLALALPAVGAWIASTVPLLIDFVAGFVVGAIVLLSVKLVVRLIPKK